MNMNYRLLEKSDFNKGFLELLKQLTDVGDIDYQQYYQRFLKLLQNPHHKIYVLEKSERIVSCATLLVEPKFIHDCGFVGHIEDVVVDKACRGQNLGRKIIDFLTSEAERLGCYKILLDCSENNVKFYEKCDYGKKGAYMAKYLNPIKKDVQAHTLGNAITTFCSNHKYKLIIGGLGIAAGIGYLTYNYFYNEEKKENDENEIKNAEEDLNMEIKEILYSELNI